jgi:hypothetical protein
MTMAKLPALVSTLAKHDERDRSSLNHVARVIREEGYIPTTKRGIGAAGMTTEAAVNLFLGLNGCESSKEAPLAIARFRSLRLDESSLKDMDHDTLRKVASAENFGIALEHLVDGSPSLVKWMRGFIDAGFKDKRVRAIYQDRLLKLNWTSPPIAFEIELQRNPYGARISLQTWVGSSPLDAHWRTEFNADFFFDHSHFEKGLYGPSKSRRIVVTVPANVLVDIWLTLTDTKPETLEGTE